MIVEDDPAIGAMLANGLSANGHQVTWQRTGASALETARTQAPDLVLLDLGLPDLDGVDVCRDLRAVAPLSIIVILTARADEMDVIVGLESGADDYLTKPFRMTELLARVRAHLRRSPPVDPPVAPRVVGDLRVDPESRQCFVRDREVILRPKEFDLLARLIETPGSAVARDVLMADVWDENWFGSTKTLDVHVAALRQALKDASDVLGSAPAVPTITTLRGFGYRLDP